MRLRHFFQKNRSDKLSSRIDYMADEVIHISLESLKNKKKIIVVASTAQLLIIKKDLAITDKDIKRLNNDMYELTLKSINVQSPEIATQNMSVNQLMGESVDTMDMFDFNGSEAFYSKAAKKKGYKIISDEYSDLRNQELYKGFQLIERGWRKLVLTWNIQHDVATEPKNSKVYDHAISTYTLADFFEQFLFAPASEKYIREQWRNNEEKTENDVVQIASLQRLDEIGMKMTEDELRTIQKRRNQCMHFRVITHAEYSETVNLINKYLIEEIKKDFIDKTMQSVKAISSHLYESLGLSFDNIKRMTDQFATIQVPTITWPTISPSMINYIQSMAGIDVAAKKDKK